MKNVNSHFSDEELDSLKKIGIQFDPEHDYTDDELLDMYEKIEDELPCAFDDKGEPLKSGRIFESIVDKFYDDFDI